MKLVQRCRSDDFMQSEQESVCDNCNMFRRSAPFARSVKVLKQPCSLYTGGGGGGAFKCVICSIMQARPTVWYALYIRAVAFPRQLLSLRPEVITPVDYVERDECDRKANLRHTFQEYCFVSSRFECPRFLLFLNLTRTDELPFRACL